MNIIRITFSIGLIVVTGVVHAACTCPDHEYSTSKNKPFFVLHNKVVNKTFIACAEDKNEASHELHSAYEIFICGDDKPITEAGEWGYGYKLSGRHGALVSTEMVALQNTDQSVGAPIPFEETVYSFSKNGKLQTSTRNVLNPPPVSEAFKEEAFELYNKFDKGSWGSTNLAGMLLSIALTGDKHAEALLFKMRQDFGWDGVDGEIYDDLLDTYKRYQTALANKRKIK